MIESTTAVIAAGALVLAVITWHARRQADIAFGLLLGARNDRDEAVCDLREALDERDQARARFVESQAEAQLARGREIAKARPIISGKHPVFPLMRTYRGGPS